MSPNYLATYLFVVNFMDRVFLKPLRYGGPHIRRKALSPTIKQSGSRHILD
jgi:hypothetical protein